jgi:hypothetical protein
MGGSSPVVDPHGNVYVASADGYNRGPGQRYDDSDAVLELSPTMHLESICYPRDWQTLSGDDLDPGTGGPALVDGFVFQSVRRTSAICCVRDISAARRARSRRVRSAVATPTADTQ